MANLLKFFSIFVIICSASTVIDAVRECYFCADQGENSGCAKANNASMVKQVCNLAATNNLPAHLGFLSKSNVDSKATDFTWVCAKIETEDMSDSSVIFTVRSCIPDTILTQDACDYVEHSAALLGQDVNTCKTCDEELCNSSASLQISFVLITFAVLSKLLFL